MTLNYLAQGALILNDPQAVGDPFFLLVPTGLRLPVVVLATAATVIASQAVISGAFSMSRQAVHLGLLPRLRVRHTSPHHEGQVYLPGVNRGLFAAVLTVALTFVSSTRLASAYGVAVTGTFLITTALFLFVARASWGWAAWRLALIGGLLGLVELAFFGANLLKVPHGGWLTVLLAVACFTVMSTWQRGRVLVTARRSRVEGPLRDVLRAVRAGQVQRVPGMAVFPHAARATTPLALRANIEHNHVLHERNIIISGRTEHVPHIPWNRRLTVEPVGDGSDGVLHVDVAFGFQDRTDFPEALHRALAQVGEDGRAGWDAQEVSYFISHIDFHRTRHGGMRSWRKRLFITLAHNAASQVDALHLPVRRTVIMGEQIDL